MIDLGMPRDRIVLGYNAVDNQRYASQAERARQSTEGRQGLPSGTLLPGREPVRSREEPRSPGPGLRTLPEPPRRVKGRGIWCCAAEDPPPPRWKRL